MERCEPAAPVDALTICNSPASSTVMASRLRCWPVVIPCGCPVVHAYRLTTTTPQP